MAAVQSTPTPSVVRPLLKQMKCTSVTPDHFYSVRWSFKITNFAFESSIDYYIHMNNDRLINDLIDSLSKEGLLSVINRIYLFGSRARKDATKRSDYDLAFDCPVASDRDWLAIIDVVETLPTLLKIDVIRYNIASEELRQKIQDEGKVVYE